MLHARADADHFVEINEMVGNLVAVLFAGFARLVDDRDEIAEVGVFEHPRQLARRPEFVALSIDALDSLKGIAADWRWRLAAHGFDLQ